jgi:GNAT superfamily N-acetyltransferase
MPIASSLAIHPLTPDRWPDFEALMGPKGGVGGCWCMLWRQSKRDYEANAGEDNRKAMRRLVQQGPPPGLLAYEDEACVGWLSLAPRSAFPRLEGSRVLQPVDVREVWSLTCRLIARSHRRRGIGTALLQAAAGLARSQGARRLEGYPVAPREGRYPDAYAWTGIERQFRDAGFQEVARRSPTRPILRKAAD